MKSHEASVDFFKKQSKILRRDFDSGSAAAHARVSSIIKDLDNISLMKFQHVIAVESGFLKWDGLLRASERELRVAAAIAKEPHLNLHGVGVYDDGTQSQAKLKIDLVKNRKSLRASWVSISEVAEWLHAFVEKSESINKDQTSYGIKHVVEDHLGRYVSNGELIAAAILVGYKYEVDEDGPNVHFAMSAKSIKEIEDDRYYDKKKVGMKSFQELLDEACAKKVYPDLEQSIYDNPHLPVSDVDLEMFTANIEDVDRAKTQGLVSIEANFDALAAEGSWENMSMPGTLKALVFFKKKDDVWDFRIHKVDIEFDKLS